MSDFAVTCGAGRKPDMTTQIPAVNQCDRRMDSSGEPMINCQMPSLLGLLALKLLSLGQTLLKHRHKLVVPFGFRSFDAFGASRSAGPGSLHRQLCQGCEPKLQAGYP